MSKGPACRGPHLSATWQLQTPARASWVLQASLVALGRERPATVKGAGSEAASHRTINPGVGEQLTKGCATIRGGEDAAQKVLSRKEITLESFRLLIY